MCTRILQPPWTSPPRPPPPSIVLPPHISTRPSPPPPAPPALEQRVELHAEVHLGQARQAAGTVHHVQLGSGAEEARGVGGSGGAGPARCMHDMQGGVRGGG